MKRLLLILLAVLTITTTGNAADWNKPQLTDTYTNFLGYLSARLNDVATGFSSAPTNQPTNTIRWNSSTSKWEKYNGSAWVDLASLYAVNISGNAASATTAGNATNLNNQPGSYYQPAATAITTSNIAAQSVNYAGSAGSATNASNATNASGTGTIPYSRYVSGLRIVIGQVNSDGTKGYGTGFTSARNSVGNYTITWSDGWGWAPMIVANVSTGAGGGQSVRPLSGSAASTFFTYSNTFALTDYGFNFIAIGPN